MSLHEIRLEIPADAAVLADEVLLEAGGAHWSVLEDAIARRAWLVGVGASEDEARAQWSELSPLLAAAGVVPLGPPAERTLSDADWRDSYKQHFKPWRFGRLHWVPVWERDSYVVPPGDAVLWLDPGLAFGTGNHETTRLCVERLVALAPELGVPSLEDGVQAADSHPGGRSENSKLQTPNSKLETPNSEPRVIDAGCGSGILALSAALLGFRDVTGFDNDAEAVRVSEENAALNGLTGRVRFSVADLVSGLAGREAEIVLANIQADVLMRFARELVGAVAPGGVLVLSGILADENAQVREAFAGAAPDWPVNARTMGEWSDVVLTRPK